MTNVGADDDCVTLQGSLRVVDTDSDKLLCISNHAVSMYFDHVL